MGEQPSHLRAALRLVAQGIRSRGAGEAERDRIPRRRVAVEYPALVIDPRRVARYLRVTGGEEIESLQGSEAVLPPTYPAVWETALALELLAREGVPFPARGLVHMQSEMIALRPIPAGERVRCRVELEHVESHPRGVHLLLRCRNWSAAGQLCQENALGLLVRTGGKGGGGRPRPATGGEEEGEWMELAEWELPAGLGRRYARVSGDYNPIHLWRWSSRLLGFKRPILHGFCTEAMVAHALVKGVLGGDPAALRRLRVDFRAPLPLPARVRLLVRPDPHGGHGRFRVAGEAKRPYAEGEYVGSPPQG